MSVYENFDEQKQFACRVIADHARATAFAIADGILPGNEGRNYVLRKIMRRAIYHGREHLGFHDLFFYKVCDFVVDRMKDAYPELEVQREFIGKMVRLEEERFGATMTVGLKKLDEDYFSNLDYKSFEEIFDELFSFEERINLWEGFSSEEIDEKRREFEKKFDVDELLVADDLSVNLAGLVYKLRVPPYIVLGLIDSAIGWGTPAIKTGLNTDELLNIRKFRLLQGFLHLIFRDKGTDEEKKIAENFESEVNTNFLNILDVLFEGTKEKSYPNFKVLARNYDTFGTPRDLIRVKLEEKKIFLEEEYFNESFDLALTEIQKQSAIGKTERKSVISPIYHKISEKTGANKFHGYERTDYENSKVVALVKDDQQINELNEGEEGLIVLNETPFYAESGGQVGDVGVLFNANSQTKVYDTFAPVAGIVLHKSKIEKGSIKVGDTVSAAVDVEKRDAIRRNHTATHLVHAALKEVLGTHVKQAGSVVAPNYLRFDFTHYQPISEAELLEIEDLVNREILKNDAVNTDLMSIEDAMRSGAMALFGEKYGSTVRVLSVGDGEFSKELCGGTHVRATGDIGSFKILSDEAVASGVRRIRAITGLDAFARFREDEQLIEKSLGALRTQRDNLPNAIEKLQEELKKARRENDDLKMKIATGAIGSATSNGDKAKDVSGVKVIVKTVDGLDKGGMRHLSDTLMAKLKSGVVILARTEEGKVSFIVRVSDDLTDRVKAGKIVQEIAPIVGGRGGGKADMAEGGGTDASKLPDALEASYGVIEEMLESKNT